MKLEEIATECMRGKHEINSPTVGPIQTVNGNFYEKSFEPGELVPFKLSCFDLSLDDWEIIPSEPEILTAEELLNTLVTDDLIWSDLTTEEKEAIETYGDRCDLNGKRKYYKHVEPLIKACKEYQGIGYSRDIADALEKIENPK